MLVDHPHLPANPIQVRLFVQNVLPVDQNLPGGGDHQPVDAPQQGALAAAGAADDGHRFPQRHVEVYVLQDGACAVIHGQVVDSDHARAPPFRVTSRPISLFTTAPMIK